MEEQREEIDSVGDCRVPMEETGKALVLVSKTETLEGEVDANTVEVSDSGVFDVIGTDENPNGDVDVASVKDTVGSVTRDNVEKKVSSFDASGESEKERIQMECEGNDGAVEVKLVNGESVGEEEAVISGGNVVSDDEIEKANCEVEEGGVDQQQIFQAENSQPSSVDGETLSVLEDKDEQEKESVNKSGEDNTNMDVDSKHANEENVGLKESETKDDKHSESAQVPEEPTQFSIVEGNKENPGTVSEVSCADEVCYEEEITNVNQKEINGEAMEIDDPAEEQVKKDVQVAGALGDAGANVVVRVDRNDSNVVKEMDTDELKESVDMATDLSGATDAADCLAKPKSPSDDDATGEVEPLDHNALFDPSSDITNFIDFTGVSYWSGNIQDHKTETNSSLKEDNKDIALAKEVASVDCKEICQSVDAKVNAESHNNLSLGAEENLEEKNHVRLDKEAVYQLDAVREEDDSAHEAPSGEPNHKEDTEMEENPNIYDYAEDGIDSDVKTNGVKRKADVLSEDSLGEGSKTVSLAKVSSFKIGSCIARAASQMAEYPSVLKGSNFGDETLSVESCVSQLHCAATDPEKENAVSEGGTEAFEFEEMGGDTYWTDKVIHNGGEEQKPPTEKENYQVVPVELKPAQVKRTRRPYRRRQSQIISSLPPTSVKPADFDENAPAELIMNFSETDTIPPERSLSKMFSHFGPIKDSQTEIDTEKNRARVVFRKGADAEVAYKSAGRFNIFGTKAVNYELSFTVTETFKVKPYVVSLGEEEAAHCVPS